MYAQNNPGWPPACLPARLPVRVPVQLPVWLLVKLLMRFPLLLPAGLQAGLPDWLPVLPARLPCGLLCRLPAGLPPLPACLPVQLPAGLLGKLINLNASAAAGRLQAGLAAWLPRPTNHSLKVGHLGLETPRRSRSLKTSGVEGRRPEDLSVRGSRVENALARDLPSVLEILWFSN